MVTPASAQPELMQTIQSLIHYYAPSLQPTVATVAGGFAAIVLGLLIAFRSAKVARGLVCLIGIAAGAAAGYRIALSYGGPAPVSAAIGGVIIGALAWRTHRLWLAIGSVAAITLAATVYQVGAKGDITTFFRGLQGGQQATEIPVPRLVSAAEQQQNLSNDPKQLIEKLWRQTSTAMQSWGLRGWLWPALALVAGVILAFWALSMVAVMWLALAGAFVAVSGATSLILMVDAPQIQQIHQFQQDIVQRPEYLLGAVGVVWVCGLIWQAKASRSVAGKSGPRSAVGSA